LFCTDLLKYILGSRWHILVPLKGNVQVWESC
jgi:hypothetical protein